MAAMLFHYLIGNPIEVHSHGNHGDAKKILEEERSSKRKGDFEEICSYGFQMPLHYPRYSKADYLKMEAWKMDLLLKEYGLTFHGGLEEKRAFLMGAFLWPDQY